jgi:glycosyltransferase involved in cell wall biosynthesis
VKILFITTVLPAKARSGGECVSNLLVSKLISLGHDVDVLGYLRLEDEIETPPNMRLVKKTVIESSGSKFFTVKNIAKSIFCGRCYSSQKYVSREYVDSLKNCFGEGITTVLIHLQMGWILDYIPRNVKVIAVNYNVESDFYEKMSQGNIKFALKLLYRREAKLVKRLEARVFKRADLSWNVTEENNNRYMELFPQMENKFLTLCVPPNTEQSNFAGNINAGKKFDIGMIGSWTWDANNRGLLWFFDEIYPLLPPSATIGVAGMGADWLRGKYPNVRYLGFVESAEDFMRQSKTMAVPSISGDGIQVKTINYIGAGINTVATSFAVRGIGELPSYVKIADKAGDFSRLLAEAIENFSKDNSQEAME